MNLKRITLVTLLVLLVSACAQQEAPPMPTPDVNAIYTAAAKTIVAEISATAAAAEALTPLASPTAEPAQTEAPVETLTEPPVATDVLLTPADGTSEVSCDIFRFIEDVNYPDGTEVTPGQEFIKTWKIQNASPCTWGAGYQLVYAGYADKMSGAPLPLPSVVAPGEIIEVSVQFKAPSKAGEYVSAWTLANALGIAFHDVDGKPFYIKVVVR